MILGIPHCHVLRSDFTPPLLEAEQRIASRRRIAAPALFRLLRSLAGKSSFFTRSTQLLAREIARIANRQYLSIPAARHEKERSPLASSLSLLLANVISAIMFTYTLLLLRPRRHAGRLPLPPRAVTPRRRRYVQSRFLEYTRDQEARL